MAIGGVAAGLVLVIGAFLTRMGDSRGHDANTDAPVDQEIEPPANANAGQAGAVEVALAITTSSQDWLYLTDDQLGRAVSDMATTRARERLTDRIVGEVQAAREAMTDATGRVWWVVHPLAWRVERFGDGDARIDVWTVGILSASGVAPPQAEWSTLTLDLVWADGRWRLDDLSDRPGPTPMTGPTDDPWDAERLDEELAGFTRIGAEAAR